MSAIRVLMRLRELLDVLVSSPADGEVLTYESASSKWKNLPAAGGGVVPFVGASPPGSPTDGELWWDTDDATPVGQPITDRECWVGFNVVINDGEIGFLTWDNQTVGVEPSPWLDNTIPSEPAILEAGIYAVSVMGGADAMTSGGGLILGLFLDSESGESTTVLACFREVGGLCYGSISTTFYLPVGAQLLARVESHDGAMSRNFKLAEAVLQKIT